MVEKALSIDDTIAVNDVSLTLDGHVVFDQLSIRFDVGKWHSVLGRSGVGKTSLLRLIAGLQGTDSGLVCFGRQRRGCQTLAYHPQQDSLLPWLTVIDNVMLGPRLRREVSQATRRRATRLLEQLGIGGWSAALPSALSGGMRQRVALARTLLGDPQVILMDEPFSSLDAITRHELQNLSSELLKGKTVILVTHDPTEALRLSHVVHVLPASISEPVQTLFIDREPPRDHACDTVVQGHAALWALLEDQQRYSASSSQSMLRAAG